jgi:hypothetical protein
MCITCGSEQDTLYKIINTKMCILCKTMCLIPHSLHEYIQIIQWYGYFGFNIQSSKTEICDELND